LEGIFKMPFTEDFLKIRRKFRNQYGADIARADTFAFEQAFKIGLPTFRGRKPRFKRLI